MPDVFLTRFAYTPMGTFGCLRWAGLSARIYTIERPWADNAAGESCIPEGEYTCKPNRFNAGGYGAIEVTGVPNRSLILFHKANVSSELRGCIAPGLDLATLGGEWAVLRSAEAFSILMGSWGSKSFVLKILSAAGPTSLPWR